MRQPHPRSCRLVALAGAAAQLQRGQNATWPHNAVHRRLGLVFGVVDSEHAPELHGSTVAFHDVYILYK